MDTIRHCKGKNMQRTKRIYYRMTREDIKRLGITYISIIALFGWMWSSRDIIKNTIIHNMESVIGYIAIILMAVFVIKVYKLRKNNHIVKNKYDRETVQYIDQIISETCLKFRNETKMMVIKELSEQKFGGNAFLGKFILLKGDWYKLGSYSKDEIQGLLYQTLFHEIGHKDNEPILELGIFELYTSVVKFKNWTRECRCDRYGRRELIKRGYANRLELLASIKWDEQYNGGITHPNNELRKRIYLSEKPFVEHIKDIAIEAGLNEDDNRINNYIKKVVKNNQVNDL